MKMGDGVMVMAALALCAVPTQAEVTAGARGAILQYLKAHATGDPAEMRKAFWPTARIEGVREGRFVSWTVDEYCARFDGRPAADEAQRRRTIDAVDATGTAASARVTLVHGRTTFTDYFVLLEVNGEWRIANKVYVAAATPQGVSRSE